VGVESIPKCLDDVVVLLRTRIAELNLPAVDDTLQIIYRSQNKYPDRRRRNKGKDQETIYIPTTHEADEIAKAIEMSLEDVFEVQLAAALKESALVNALAVVSGSETHPGGFNPDQGSVRRTSTGLELPPIADGSTLGSKRGEGSNVLEREPTFADLSGESRSSSVTLSLITCKFRLPVSCSTPREGRDTRNYRNQGIPHG
jgi:hypothetical protein